MKNIYILGFMGTGKSAAGRLLAKSLNREFVEMDEVIEGEQGKPISSIFSEEGETHFRKLEKELLTKLALNSGLIVSCGGGLVCDSGNLELLKKSGVLICLSASAEVIHQRTKKHVCRPLLNVEDPLKKIDELLKVRKPYYDQADHIIDTDKLSPEEIVDKIKKLLDKDNG